MKRHWLAAEQRWLNQADQAEEWADFFESIRAPHRPGQQQQSPKR
jgi:hypothetical protein